MASRGSSVDASLSASRRLICRDATVENPPHSASNAMNASHNGPVSSSAVSVSARSNSDRALPKSPTPIRNLAYSSTYGGVFRNVFSPSS